MQRSLMFLGVFLIAVSLAAAPAPVIDVKAYGATGDGKTLETAAINKAIEAAAAAGGGTVYFPAGRYVSGSIHLKSNITLYFDQGSTLEASTDPLAFDEAEPNAWSQYQDFGHSHWHNSLIWGEGLENVSILGPGLIYGKGLTRAGGQRIGNKVIGLKLCRNVIIRDLSILMAGHFGILATGVDNLTIDNLKIDTNRDGINIDSCRHVHISNCSINSPRDDGIVIKTTHALGYPRSVENLTITNSEVSGFNEGTFLGGTYERGGATPQSRLGATGRIKIGTESEAAFKNIAVSNVVFDHCRGLALESVDGAPVEDIVIDNVTMRDIVNAPIFLRLGARMRAPEGTPIGTMKRVTISNVNVYDADPRYGSIISGIPGHEIEDVTLSNIRIYYQGGGTKEQAALEPPENEKMYPEPSMFGVMPAYGFYIRHAKGLRLRDIEIHLMKDDLRPPFQLNDVQDVEFFNVQAPHADGVPSFVLKNLESFSVQRSKTVPDTQLKSVTQKEM
jgi:polygalacturonase